jgi:hypothetical protein
MINFKDINIVMVLFTDGIYSRLAATIADTTQSTSSSTGALIVSGGLGIAKNLNVGGTFTTSDLSISNNLYVGGTLTSGSSLIANGTLRVDNTSKFNAYAEFVGASFYASTEFLAGIFITAFSPTSHIRFYNPLTPSTAALSLSDTGELSFLVNNNDQLIINTSRALFSNRVYINAQGSASAPSLTFTYSEIGEDTGIYHPNDGQICFTCNSIQTISINPFDILFYGPGGYRFEFLNNSTIGDIFRIRQHMGGGGGGYFYYNNSNNYGTISDRRIKTDIGDIDEAAAIQTIKNLIPRKFKYKTMPLEKENIGFIAQEVLQACGDFPLVSDNGYDENDENSPLLGVNDSTFIPIIIATLKYILK